MIDYVKPSQELIGLLEESFKNGKFKWIHVGSIRSMLNAENDNNDSESAVKNVFRKHTSCFMQRIETLMNAFLLLSYDTWDPTVQDRSALILTREYANLYLDHLRRYCSIAGETDPFGYGSEVIHEMDKKMRNEWAEAAASIDGIPTRLDDLISEQLNSKMSKTDFLNKIKDTRNRNQSEGIDADGVKRVWKDHKWQNVVTNKIATPTPKKTSNKSNWGTSTGSWNQPKKNDWSEWKKNDWSGKRPSQTTPTGNPKKQKQDKGTACPFKEQCKFKDTCRMAHSMDEIQQFQAGNQ